ncbi:LysR family transcriptional regulator [Ochrobactrum pecoris]|uniref:LysR family transcriptional regulator n=1 Tax=Brucella pecoris TaxID=867683 RepID=UPI001443A6A9|nr:LysR family transcriptional regulator [Brucella pecoris]
MVNLHRSVLADLNIFVTIIRRQSMKQAANEIGVSTSAISHRIRKLEYACQPGSKRPAK